MSTSAKLTKQGGTTITCSLKGIVGKLREVTMEKDKKVETLQGKLNSFWKGQINDEISKFNVLCKDIMLAKAIDTRNSKGIQRGRYD